MEHMNTDRFDFACRIAAAAAVVFIATFVAFGLYVVLERVAS